MLPFEGILASLVGGFKPFEKYAYVKLDHFLRDRGENKKHLKPPPRVYLPTDVPQKSTIHVVVFWKPPTSSFQDGKFSDFPEGIRFSESPPFGKKYRQPFQPLAAPPFPNQELQISILHPFVVHWGRSASWACKCLRKKKTCQKPEYLRSCFTRAGLEVFRNNQQKLVLNQWMGKYRFGILVGWTPVQRRDPITSWEW